MRKDEGGALSNAGAAFGTEDFLATLQVNSLTYRNKIFSILELHNKQMLRRLELRLKYVRKESSPVLLISLICKFTIGVAGRAMESLDLSLKERFIPAKCSSLFLKERICPLAYFIARSSSFLVVF